MTIISMISAKGGVGKTTVTSNLGVVLCEEFGKKVLLIDGNVTTPTLGVQLGMLSQEKTLIDVLDDHISTNQAVYMHPSGVHVIPSSLAINQQYGSIEKLKEKLSEVKDTYDTIIIDGAAGIGKEVMSVLEASDYTIIVVNPEISSVTAAIKAIKVAKMLNVPVMGVVVNMARGKGYELKNSEIEELTECKIIATIPYDENVHRSARQRTPVVTYSKGTSSRRSLRKLAGFIVNEPIKESFFDKIRMKIPMMH